MPTTKEAGDIEISAFPTYEVPMEEHLYEFMDDGNKIENCHTYMVLENCKDSAKNATNIEIDTTACAAYATTTRQNQSVVDADADQLDIDDLDNIYY